MRRFSSRTSSSGRWLERQRRDMYVKQAAQDGYCSRAAYKLIELDKVRVCFQTPHAARHRRPPV